MDTSGCNGGIKREELLQSIASGLTEPTVAVNQPGGVRLTTREVAKGPAVYLSNLAMMLRLGLKQFKSYFQHLSLLIVSCVVAVLACSLRGDVLLFATLSYKTYLTTTASMASQTARSQYDTSTVNSNNLTNVSLTSHCTTILPEYLQVPGSWNLPDLLFYVVASILVSESVYHVICAILQVYFYMLKRSRPEEWKCQPHRFLTRSNEIHEVVVGTSNLVLAGGVSGVIACWISSSRYTTMYFSPREYGYPYLALSVILLFLWLEASAYYIHMTLHKPFLYKTIHKHHHRYHSPTAYSALAMSPFELLMYDAAVALPIFVMPINSVIFMSELAYIYYFSLMDHSGIKMDSWFPWQPSTIFHDDHHRYFHCNFGFNTYLFDWLHGTMRRNDRTYGEHIFNPNKKED